MQDRPSAAFCGVSLGGLKCLRRGQLNRLHSDAGVAGAQHQCSLLLTLGRRVIVGVQRFCRCSLAVMGRITGPDRARRRATANAPAHARSAHFLQRRRRGLICLSRDRLRRRSSQGLPSQCLRTGGQETPVPIPVTGYLGASYSIATPHWAAPTGWRCSGYEPRSGCKRSRLVARSSAHSLFGVARTSLDRVLSPPLFLAVTT